MTLRISAGHVLAIAALLPLTPSSQAQDAWFTPEPADQADALSLALPPSTLKLPPAGTVAPPARPTTAMPPPPDSPQSGFRLNAGIALSMADTDNPPVGLSVDLLGHDPAKPANPVRVSGNLPFATTSDVRTPQRQMGVGASYTLPPSVLARATLGASFDLNNYGPTEIGREGLATVRIGF